jgi:hypothetical protein
MARKVIVELVGDADNLNKALGSSSKEAKSFGQTLGGLGKTAGLAAGAAGLGALVVTLKIGIGEWKDSQKVAAQTAAVLKSTGGVAGVTAKEVDQLSQSLLRKSGVDDEAIKSGENMLLTFKGIRNEAGAGNDVFNQTTKTLLDMTTALTHGNVTSEALSKQAIQLGKAMNDPIAGLGALRRVGVTFTDQQKEQIKAMVESGNTMGAQKMILAELNSEFGGSAAAMGQTLPGQISILKESFNNFAGELVGKMVPAIQVAIGWLKDHWPEIHAALASMWASVQPILDSLRDLVTAVAGTIKQHWGSIGPVVEAVGRIVKDMGIVIAGTIQLVADLLQGKWGAAWADAKRVVFAVFDEIKTYLGTIIGVFAAIAGRIGQGFVEGLKIGLGALGSALSAAIRAPLNAIIFAWDALGTPEITFPSIDTHLPGIGKIGGFTIPAFHVPQIPLLDTGGFISQTGMAVVHRGETVIPAGGASGGDLHAHVYLDGTQISEVVYRDFLRKKSRNGTLGLA